MKTEQRAPGAATAAVPAKRPTLKTIAELTGLAVTTVSRALKDGPELNERTKERVRAVAAEIGYLPDRAGVRLRTGRTYVVGLILDQNDEIPEFARRIIIGISRVLRETRYHLVVTPEFRGTDPMEPVRYILETGAADGIVFTHTRPLDPRVRLLLERGFPFVTHGRTELATPHPYHDYDNYAFGQRAAHRLIERGRRRLALVRPPREFTYHQQMVHGFMNAVTEAGAHVVDLAPLTLDTSPGELRTRVAALSARPGHPDGYVCASEGRCVALMAGLKDAGLEVGRDVDVIAKQTSDLLDHLTPAIDSFAEDLIHAGEELARLLLLRISGAPASELRSLGEPRFNRRT